MNKFIERFKIKFYELWCDVDEEISWRFLLWITHRWSNKHLDQWTKFTLRTKFGPVYVGLERRTEYPDSYDDYIE